MLEAMRARGLTLAPNHIRAGEFREDIAYSVARELLTQPAPPTAIYVANGVMALDVMRALADLSLKCPDDISIASTDYSRHRGSSPASHAHRASGNRYDQRSTTFARGPDQSRLWRRRPEHSLPALARCGRELCAPQELMSLRPSPALPKIRPPCSRTKSAIRLWHKLSARTVLSSSSAVRRLKPATSVERMAASFRSTAVTTPAVSNIVA
ncbi:substrate-binding domain-containing protein [Rhizobium leguminosarum]